jgi:hypothetical protein
LIWLLDTYVAYLGNEFQPINRPLGQTVRCKAHLSLRMIEWKLFLMDGLY